MKKILLTFFSIGTCFIVTAQSSIGEVDRSAEALRFALPGVSGTARIQGLGGANTALGGDVTNITGNPAGLGFYTRHDLSISPGVSFAGSNSTYQGNAMKASKGNFAIANLSGVISVPKEEFEPGAIRSWSLGFSYNRSTNFNNIFNFSGTNAANNYNQYLTESANGTPLSTFTDISQNPSPYYDPRTIQGLAYNTYLINPADQFNPNNTNYVANFNESGIQSVKQSYAINYKGAVNEFMLAGAINVRDRLYLGASGGLVYGRFRQTKEFNEKVLSSNPAYSPLNNYSLEDDGKIDAIGGKFSIGAILRPIKFFQIGVKASTPTFYRFKETRNMAMNAHYNDYLYHPVNNPPFYITNQSYSTTDLRAKYNVTTPYTASVGATVLLRKIGLATAELEYVDYTAFSMKAKSDVSQIDIANQAAGFANNYQPAVNLRAGAELAAFGKFRARAGYALYGNPYKDSYLGSRLNPKQAITGGIGLRNEDYYIDLTYVLQQYEGKYVPYSTSTGAPVANFDTNNIHSIVVTCGILF